MLLHKFLCIIFRHGKDQLFTDESAKHMLVMRKGHMYLFDAIDRDGMVDFLLIKFLNLGQL